MTRDVTEGSHLGTYKFHTNATGNLNFIVKEMEKTCTSLNRKVVRSNLYFRISLAGARRLIFVQFKFL